MTNLEEKGNKPLSYLLLTVTRGFYALFIIITWLVRKAELIGSENFTWCVRPRDFAEIFISLKAPRGLPIHRLEVKYWFFVHPNIKKTNRVKENNVFQQKNFVTGPKLVFIPNSSKPFQYWKNWKIRFLKFL